VQVEVVALRDRALAVVRCHLPDFLIRRLGVQDEIVGVQTGNGSVLHQDRVGVGTRPIKVDQQIAAAVRGGDMTGKPLAETTGIARLNAR
jgi:hypothetical protein